LTKENNYKNAPPSLFPIFLVGGGGDTGERATSKEKLGSEGLLGVFGVLGGLWGVRGPLFS